MKRVVASLLGLLVAWLALANAAAAAAEPPLRACPIYDYNSQHVCAPSADSATERGPPPAHDPHTAYNAVDRWSHGAAARPDRPTPSPIITYDLPAPLVQGAGVVTTTLEARPDSSGLLSTFQRSGVAANAVPPRFITTGAGVTIDRASVAARVAQTQGRHVAGHANYGGRGYFNSLDDAQSVLDDFHSGAAQVLGVKRNGDIVVRSPNVTGFNHNPGAGFPNQPTNVFFIKGTSSPSVVPYNPAWTP